MDKAPAEREVVTAPDEVAQLAVTGLVASVAARYMTEDSANAIFNNYFPTYDWETVKATL